MYDVIYEEAHKLPVDESDVRIVWRVEVVQDLGVDDGVHRPVKVEPNY